MSEPLDTGISFICELPAGHNVDGVRLDKTGWFAFIDKQGVEIAVTGMQRLVTPARTKGPKSAPGRLYPAAAFLSTVCRSCALITVFS
jgi:hypothetical protein